jgi:hypothetical protein
MKLDPIKDVKIDVTNIVEEFSQLPLLMYRYSELYEEARAAAAFAKLKVSEVEAQEYIKIKTSGDKVTEAHAKALVDVSPKVLDAQREAVNLQKDSNTYNGVLESLKCKLQALITIGAHQRAENK